MRIEKKKIFIMVWRTGLIILVNLMVIAMLLNSGSAQALSKYGSTGSEVTQIQQRLQELGYDPGTADGIYGTRTKNAIIAFQRDYGLSDDGIAGPKTLEALGLTGGGGSGGGSYGGFSESDVQLLAKIISAESRDFAVPDAEIVRQLTRLAADARVINTIAHAWRIGCAHPLLAPRLLRKNLYPVKSLCARHVMP